jgi:hypothetical protein
MFIPDIGSWILDPDFCPSQMPSPGSRIQKQEQKERGENKFVVLPFFVATKNTKLKIILILNSKSFQARSTLTMSWRSSQRTSKRTSSMYPKEASLMLAIRRPARTASNGTRKGPSWMTKRRAAKGSPWRMEKRMARPATTAASRERRRA